MKRCVSPHRPFTARWAALVVVAVAAVIVPAPPAVALSPDWHRYVLGPETADVKPVRVDSRGPVTHADALVHGRAATLTTTAGTTPASVVLDFGQDIAGTPHVDVTALAGNPTLTLVTGEA